MRVPRPGGGRLPGRAPSATLPVAAAVVTAAATLDVLAGGPLRHLDHDVFSGGLPPRTGAWHWTWRTVVNGGQYWLAGSLVAVTAAVAARRRRSLPTLLGAALWLAATEAVVRGAQMLFARTPPLAGRDELFAGGSLSYPSGHAANAAACLLFAAALAGASRGWTIAAHTLALGVAAAVVALGYHWPSDACAGWGIGVLMACAGRALVARRPPPPRGHPPGGPRQAPGSLPEDGGPAGFPGGEPGRTPGRGPHAPAGGGRPDA
ncbi:phosphatase PAP2 family protein [Actinomadura graeca]|uniref:Phosphatase PAP2 family protein n=1 Tax=Actinomadura graeca TaxID=2750812 RepID=A0ABX8QML1_9ACTN|nr:phosphatase PAP2 family protein [Actinomadura graeca]QXJ19601.1 phosphatase PAP2 family protein [Actinomadura graeca]